MGRGDKRTAKGKRFKGSFGKSRRHKVKKSGAPASAPKAVETTEAPAKKPRKKKAE